MSSAAGVHGVKQNLVGNSVSRVMDCEVAVIGAGPYGLAAAAHLKSKGSKSVCSAGQWSFGRTRCRRACSFVLLG